MPSNSCKQFVSNSYTKQHIQCCSGSHSQSPVCTGWTSSTRKMGLSLKSTCWCFFPFTLSTHRRGLCQQEMSEGTTPDWGTPGHHRMGTIQQQQASPRAGRSCTLQAEQDVFLHARSTQSSCRTPGSEKETTTPFAALTKAPLLPSSLRPQYETNITSTQQCSDCCTYVYKHTQKYTFLYTYMYTFLCIHVCAYIYTYAHTYMHIYARQLY